MKKGISKLTKSKIMTYSFIAMFFIVGACSVSTYFVGNVTKYWLYFITSNYASILTFFIAALNLSVLILFDPNRKLKIIGIITLIGITLICGLIFINLALPLDRDIYAMITRSYSEVNGPVVASRLKHIDTKLTIRNIKPTDTELTIHDIKRNENITITFFNQSSSAFKVGANINVKYLPHSHMGISYLYTNESFISKNPFSCNKNSHYK